MSVQPDLYPGLSRTVCIYVSQRPVKETTNKQQAFSYCALVSFLARAPGLGLGLDLEHLALFNIYALK